MFLSGISVELFIFSLSFLVCSPEPPANGRIDSENTEVFGVGDLITFECLPGFQLSEDSIPINFCQEDGTLANPLPTCESG